MKKLLQLTMVFIAFMPAVIQPSQPQSPLGQFEYIFEDIASGRYTLEAKKNEVKNAYNSLSSADQEKAQKMIKSNGFTLEQFGIQAQPKKLSNDNALLGEAIEKLWKLESTSATKEADLHQAARETLNAFNGLSADDRMMALQFLEVNSYDLAPWSKKLKIPMVGTAFAQEVKEQKEQVARPAAIDYVVVKPRKGGVDCTYESVLYGNKFYEYAQKNKKINVQELENILARSEVPKNWMDEAGKLGEAGDEYASLQPDFYQQVLPIITNLKILPVGSFAVLMENPRLLQGKKSVQDALKEEQASDLGRMVKELRDNAKPNITKIFLAFYHAHWFMIAAHKVDNKITYYVIDDLYHDQLPKYKGGLSDKQKEVLSVLKSLIEGKLSLVK